MLVFCEFGVFVWCCGVLVSWLYCGLSLCLLLIALLFGYKGLRLTGLVVTLGGLF